MSWLAVADHLADTSELAATASLLCGQARATGLDWSSFRGLIGASLCLGAWPTQGDVSTAWASDEAAVTAIWWLAEEVRGHCRRVEKLIFSACRRAAQLRARLGNPDEHQGMLRAELSDIIAALEVARPVPPRLVAAVGRLDAVPLQLGEAYAAVYALIAAGHRMPHHGRWITGQT